MLGLRVLHGQGGAVLPLVDGISLVELVGAYETSQRHDVPGSYDAVARDIVFDLGEWDAADQGARPTTLLGCKCGEAGCWPLRALIRSDRGLVVWERFEHPHRPDRDYSGFGPFVFARPAYDRALSDAREPRHPRS